MGKSSVCQLLLSWCFLPVVLPHGAANKIAGEAGDVPIPIIEHVSPTNAPPNSEVRIVGRGFGAGQGWVVLSGLRVEPQMQFYRISINP